MRTFWLLYVAEFKLSFREMSSFIFGLFLPVGIMVIMGYLSTTNEELVTTFAAVATLGLVSTGVMSLPLSLSSYREKKVLKRYKVTPISPVQLLVAHVFYCFSLSILSMFAVFLVATFGFNMIFPGSIGLFLISYLFVMISIHSIGMLIASTSPREKTTAAMSSLLFFSMFLLSGATIPFDLLPSVLQSIAQLLPLTHGIELLQGQALGTPFTSYSSLLLLLVITTIATTLSLRFFRWE
ncbi:ABC transporter permease [Geomicrobium sp. JCM 19038]|uniref:ABC transporter permease n=1 Tax=Geomicrobium sp. JCM 19038 TaxID=1460635 RepID=UPI00045F4311|nr:ABC transporter permease [Geomicrobium sp. JCM 19038]GAK09361.1 ABC-type multidrug transport system, permease component [Geomicrobium sp. JCM 19038]